MNEYEFAVSLCGGYANGTIVIEAENDDAAYEKALEYVGQKLYEAFPELDIDYTVEFV